MLTRVSRRARKGLDLLYQSRLIPGTRDYRKFIILGTGRTGSNMLLSALNSHPNIVAYGEVFNNTSHEKIHYSNQRQPYLGLQQAIRLREHRPIDFLERCIFRRFPNNVQAVGFKLFYWHCRENNWKCVWDHVTSMKDLLVVHIKRRNRLKTLVSLKIAQTANEWSRSSAGASASASQITIDPDECVRTFMDWEDEERRHDEMFQDHAVHSIFYEDLVNAYDTTMGEVLGFLDLPGMPLKVGTVKQSPDDLSVSIRNYPELHEALKDTRWSEYFEE